MVERVAELGDEGRIPRIRIGVGLNSGTVVAGNVGNESRKFYSLTGRNVIIAARVEQLNKEYTSQVLVSESVVHGLGGSEDPGEDLGEVALKGIETPVRIFRAA